MNNKQIIEEEERKIKVLNKNDWFTPGTKKVAQITIPYEDLIKVVDTQKEWDLGSGNAILDAIYEHQKVFYEENNTKKYNDTKYYIKYIEHQLKDLHTFQDHLLTLTSIIFLPLGVIVGFFGMNFKSMGVPSLKKGIFNFPQADKAIFIGAICISIAILITYFTMFKGLGL